MYQRVIKNLDLRQIMLSGQCFRMAETEIPGVFSIVAGDHYVEIGMDGEEFVFSCEEDEFEAFWGNYLDLSTDYEAVIRSVDKKDQYLTGAVSFGSGVRILRQDLWEMLITFLISQNNNIKRITGSVSALCEKYGSEREGKALVATSDGGFAEKVVTFKTFPTPEAIAQGGMDGLKDLGLGYRDKYVSRMAERCCGETGKDWLDGIRHADYGEAHKALCDEFGIGKKVADCISLFGLHHIDAFPVDTHIRQILDLHYPDGFPFERYQGYAGIIQQYLFYYKRNY